MERRKSPEKRKDKSSPQGRGTLGIKKEDE